MDNYQIDTLGSLKPEDMDAIQKDKDEGNCDILEQYHKVLTQIIGEDGFQRLKSNFKETMKKEAYIHNGPRKALGRNNLEAIYNLNLETGEIEINKNNKRIRYLSSVIAPCTTTAVRYWNGECGQVDVINAPMKSPERTIEKILEERIKEHQELTAESMKSLDQTFEKEDVPFISDSLVEKHCPTAEKLLRLCKDEKKALINRKRAEKAFKDIREDDLIPKDIFRLSVLVKFPEHIDKIIRHFEKNFPSYIKFTERDDNQYTKTISQNPRFYFDRKKTACVTIPDIGEKFYIEFQFKQRNMFYSHMRSHQAYEDYREAMADFEKSHSLADKKRCNEAEKRCLDIHKNAVHQSNFYLLSAIAWADDTERTDPETRPLTSNGQYLESQEMIMKNYIVETYDTPFDGVTAFSTNNNEHLNKCCYLKLSGLLPENFDETKKNAKIYINRAWQNLTPMELNYFNLITEAAIRYQGVIQEKQQSEKQRDEEIKKTGKISPIINIDNERN